MPSESATEASAHEASPPEAAAVRADMAYSDTVAGEAIIRIYPPNSGKRMEAPRRVRHQVDVHDARPRAGELDMDTAGFSLLRRPTSFTDFYEPDAVQRDYYPEVVDLLTEALGASHVFVFDHNVRSNARADAGQAGVRRPVDGAHNDYTLASGPRRIGEVLEANGATDLAARRTAIVNVWRPIRGPVHDHPLAICDARSTRLEDFVATRIEHYREDALAAPELTGEVYSFTYSARHRWFYAPAMQPDEVWLLKCYDSATDRARFTGHTGFVNPAADPAAPPRESIEARTVVVFPD